MESYNNKSKDELIKEIESLKRNFRDFEKNKLEFKKAEEALKASNENFQQVVSNITTIVWKADIGKNGAFENTYSSPVVDELLELPAGTIKNDWNKYFSYIKPEYLERVNNAFKEAINSHEKLIDCEYEVLKNTGQTTWFHSKGRCFKKNGKLHVFGSTVDITNRKQAEKKLRENEEKYRLLADNSTDAIWQTDLKLVFTYVSPSVKKMFGYSVEEWVGSGLSQHASRKEFFKMARKALYAIKNYKKFKYLTFEVVMLKKDGTEIPVEITGKLLLNKKGLPVGLQGTTRNITNRKQAEEKEKENFRNISLLSESAMQFSDFSPDRDMYDFICEKVKQLVGEGIVSVNSFDTEKDILRVRRVIGIGKAMQKMTDKLLGAKITDMPFSNISQDSKDLLLIRKLVKVEGGLHEMFFQHFPKSLCRQIERLTGIKDIYSIGLRRKGILLGNVTIMAFKNSRVNKNVIETFVNQASIALERKRAEEALKLSNENFQQVVSNITTVVWKADIGNKGVFENTYISPVADELLDLPAGTLQNDWDKYFRYIKPEYSELVNNAFKEAIKSPGKLIDCEYEVLKGTGQTTWFQSKGRCFEKNDKLYIFGSTTDITKRLSAEQAGKQAEKELIQKNEQLEQVMQGASIGWWDWDISSGNEIYNEILPELLGYKLGEIEPNIKWWEDKIHPDDLKQVNIDLQKHFDGETEFYINKHRLKTGTGKWKWFFDHGKVVSRDKTGKPVRMIGSLRDIDEQQRAEEALRESEKQMHTLINTMPDFVCLKDGDGCWLKTNDAGISIFQLEGIDYQGKNDSELAELNSKLRGAFLTCKESDARVRKEGGLIHGEETITDPTGKVRIFDVTKVSVSQTDDKQKGLVVLGHDITERKLAEEELKKYREHLEELVKERTLEVEEKAKKIEDSQKAMRFLLEDVNEAREELVKSNKKIKETNKDLESFAYSVSHDLKSPLRAINGYTKVLLEDYPDLFTDEKKEFMDLIVKNSVKMNTLIDDLLRFSRAGRNKLDISEFNMSVMVKDVINAVKENYKSKKIESKIQEDVIINADISAIKHVLLNLIGNAVKFSENETISKIEFGIKNISGINVYYIKDNGIGFNIKYTNKVFDVFQRLHGSEKYEGTGVGLALVKRIINKHGGKIWAESEIGKGSIFYFTI